MQNNIVNKTSAEVAEYNTRNSDAIEAGLIAAWEQSASAIQREEQRAASERRAEHRRNWLSYVTNCVKEIVTATAAGVKTPPADRIAVSHWEVFSEVFGCSRHNGFTIDIYHPDIRFGTYFSKTKRVKLKLSEDITPAIRKRLTEYFTELHVHLKDVLAEKAKKQAALRAGKEFPTELFDRIVKVFNLTYNNPKVEAVNGFFRIAYMHYQRGQPGMEMSVFPCPLSIEDAKEFLKLKEDYLAASKAFHEKARNTYASATASAEQN